MVHAPLSAHARAHADNLLDSLRRTDFQPGGRYAMGMLLGEPGNANAVARAVEAHIRAHVDVDAISADDIHVTASGDDQGFIYVLLEIWVP